MLSWCSYCFVLLFLSRMQETKSVVVLFLFFFEVSKLASMMRRAHKGEPTENVCAPGPEFCAMSLKVNLRKQLLKLKMNSGNTMPGIRLSGKSGKHFLQNRFSLHGMSIYLFYGCNTKLLPVPPSLSKNMTCLPFLSCELFFTMSCRLAEDRATRASSNNTDSFIWR